jgi:hypothetical protein
MPWVFGLEAEKVARRFLDMRYRLLPVFYAAAHENYETGEPLLRRLDLYFPQYTEARRNDEYLLGKDILVAPIFQAAQQDMPTEWFDTPQGKPGLSVARDLWIPPGSWINAWDGKIIAGPTIVTNLTPLDQIPIYVKSGAVLPLAPEMQFTGQKPWNPITLDLYPRDGETNSATLYEDDTLTTEYQHGKFRNTLITASADDANKTVWIDIGAAEGSFPGALKKRAWVLRVHKPTSWPEGNFVLTQVAINGRKADLPIQHLLRDEKTMPFGDQTGAPDGGVFELTLPLARVSKQQHVEIFAASGLSAWPSLLSPPPAQKGKAFTEFFRQTNGWAAGDGATSIPLSDGRVLWLFGDSYVSRS